MINQILRFDEIDSTQDEAKRIASKSVEGTVVISKIQQKGRGKPGSIWFSPSGGLYFSIILKPKIDVIDLLLITKITADVIVSVLRGYNVDAEIKMPNDIMVGGKKICGILVEKTKEALIVGIGINLSISEFPAGLNAISINAIIAKEIDPDNFLNQILALFNNEYSKMHGIAI